MNYPRHNYPVHIHTIDVFTQARMFQKEKHFEAEMPKQWYNKCRHIEIGLAFTSLSSHTSYGFFLIKFIHQFFFTKLWNVFFHNWHNSQYRQFLFLCVCFYLPCHNLPEIFMFISKYIWKCVNLRKYQRIL